MDARRYTAGGRSWRLLFLTAAAALAFSSVSHGQQDPRTGDPRQRWPQRPGLPRVLDLQRRLPDVAVAEPQADFAPNQVLVQFRADASGADRAAVRAAVRASAEQELRAPDGRLELLTTPLPVPDAVQILQAFAQIEFAEPNWIVRSQSAPDDPYYTDGLLWGMYSDTIAPGSEFGSQADELWARGFSGSSRIYVGVIDHGVDINHPDLAPNIWTNPFDPVDGADNDGNGYVDDVHGWDFLGRDNSVYDGTENTPAADGHGTHVTGTIGARGGNGAGVAGVNWNVSIVVTKFLGPTVFGGFTSDAVLAMNYLVDLKTRHGLDVVAANNSWAGPNYSTALHQAIIRAAKSGILTVAAAGNQGRDNDATATYPANYDTTQAAGSESPATYDAVISVAAITSSGELAGYSNFGAATVDIGAPGSGIYSTIPQNQYASWNGTSMATAHVTGAVAIYKSMNCTASAQATRDAILSHGSPTASLAGLTTTARRLNVGEFPGAMTFTDAPLVPGVHSMRAVHIAELRTCINDRRVRHGLATVAWTDVALGPSVTIKAAHLAELRAAVDGLYVALDRMPPLYTDPMVAPASTVIKAVHITELRSALEALEE